MISESLLLGKLLSVSYCMRLDDKIILSGPAKNVDKFCLNHMRT